jgi:hypothetical protein
MANLRRIFRRVVSPNPQTQSLDSLEANDEYHKLREEDGSTDSYEIREKTANDCGCFGEPGGRCAEPGCGRISCVKCVDRCGGSQNPVPEGCSMPLCGRHRHYHTMPDGRTLPFCRDCRDRLVRKERWRLIASLFVAAPADDKEDRHG